MEAVVPLPSAEGRYLIAKHLEEVHMVLVPDSAHVNLVLPSAGLS